MKKITSLLLAAAMATPSSALAQNNTTAANTNSANAEKYTAPPPPPPPKMKVMLSAFKPWSTSGQTNMAAMVADAMQRISLSHGSRIELVGNIDLDVYYDSSSEVLIERILSLPEPPDMILSLGQGTNQIAIETGATQGPSSVRDGKNQIRHGKEFTGFDKELGFNFPVQDLYCSLDSKDRRKVSVSYSPGAFVCNDLSYYMTLFGRGINHATPILDRLERSNESSYKSTLNAIDTKLKNDLAAEETRLATPEAIEARKANRAAFDANLQAIRDRNKAKLATGADKRDLETEPRFYEEDTLGTIRRQAEGSRQNAKYAYEQELQRIRRFQMIFISQNPIPFVFVHLPKSDGVVHDPVYTIENAMCLSTDVRQLGNQGSWQWVEADRAASWMKTSLSSVKKTAERIVTNAMKPENLAAAGANTLKNNPIYDCLETPEQAPKISAGFQHDFKTNKQVEVFKPAPPRARFVVALSSKASREENQEMSRRDEYASIVMKMLQGALVAQEKFQESAHFPLPTFENGKAFPRGEEEMKRVRKKIQSLSKPESTKRTLTYKTDGSKPVEGIDFVFDTRPAILTEDQAACYANFLGMAISDKVAEDRDDKRSSRAW